MNGYDLKNFKVILYILEDDLHPKWSSFNRKVK